MPGKPGMKGDNLGGRRDGAGRPRSRITLPPGTPFVMERQTIGGDSPFHPLELWRVLSVSHDEIEFQCGDDLIVLRRPDDE